MSYKLIGEEYFGAIIQNSIILLLFLMEEINQLDTLYALWFFKFKTSENLIGWEAMPENTCPKYHIFVASTDI